MYDENEQLHNMQQVARTAINTAKEIYRLYASMKEKAKENEKQAKLDEQEALRSAMRQVVNPDPNFVFTGQMTDLSYFKTTDVMPFDYIENISDEKLKSSVKDNYNKAAKNGLVFIDPESRMIVITDKGKDFINKASFKSQDALNKAEAVNQADQCATLNGTEKDLMVFTQQSEININDIKNNGSPEQGNKVMSNFNSLQAKGLINIDQKGNMTLTDKGKEAVESGKLGKSADVKSVNAIGIAGSVIVTLARNTAKTTSKAVGAAKEAVDPDNRGQASSR